MLFRDVEVGEVVICNGIAMQKIKPTFKNGRYYKAKGPDEELHYIEDDGQNIIEQDI